MKWATMTLEKYLFLLEGSTKSRRQVTGRGETTRRANLMAHI
jgi:hypothetical protein